MNKKVLIIDDDEKLQDLLVQYLEEKGYTIASLLSGEGAVDAINIGKPDIVILDIMLPGKDGFEVLQDIRGASSLPVIMLTARGEDTDRIVGLEMGADDYLTKPFNPRELLARIKAVLRRSGAEKKNTNNNETGSRAPLDCAGLILDGATYTLKCDDKQVEVSLTEYKLLEALMKRPNVALSRDELMNLARGRDFIAFDRSIDVHISKLRSKIESISGQRDVIKTMWGSGYMLIAR
ncbi:MAG: response regulator transcription factor [bacterium]|nr:response regulator transcription factor [bacterium]